MIRRVSRDCLGPIDLRPDAVIAKPPSYFAGRFGYKFCRDQDDLDEYEAAFFLLDDAIPLALIRYRGNPPDQVTLYLDNSGPSADETRARILDQLGIAAASVAWHT